MNQIRRARGGRRQAISAFGALNAIILSLAGGLETSAIGQDPPCYEVTAIVTGPDCWGSPAPVTPYALNNNGDIVGHYSCLGPRFPFLWQRDGQFITLPLPPGVAQAMCGDIEDDGRITGTMGAWASPIRAYAYEGGQMVVLEPLPGDNESASSAMSGTGRVVGSSTNTYPVGTKQAVLWDNGEIAALDLPVGPRSAAYDVSDDGSVIVGWMGEAMNQDCHGFRWEDGEVEDLGTLFGGPAASPRAVNNNRVLVGTASVEIAAGEFSPHAFVWRDGVATDLGVLPDFNYSYAYDVNDEEVIVGQCRRVYADAIEDRAIVWIDDELHDLNDLIQPGWSIELTEAMSVNEHGQIASRGMYLGSTVAVLLTPVIADLNSDCVVDHDDLLLLLGQWACSNSPADLNHDGTVNVLDLLFLLAEWTV